ncbi:LPXTG cell wall anchor domain-containing protein [Sphingomonas solaris]|uniref:LPXTG cell wall anchor domain-containing protein n=1 Tax=Alterirhizorhabdus solaris TaxID=2529389 RepID=A0A558QSE8_9SPHN|nr:LPXTG cell wall anchor domain-containing protein [Sphingomonas solaris]TVV70073.1 LPXTG cell wall anchor domain-containing protein [Sphingomonas solaris]
MIHVTAAIGLGLAALLQAMFWSIAPSAALILGGVALLGLVAVVLSRRRRRG